MAYPTDFQETLVNASGAATSILSPPKGLLDAIYTQYSSNYTGGLGQTLKITIPTVAVGNASDEGNGGVTGVAPADTTASLVINHKYGSNRKIAIYDETLSAEDLGKVYVAPVIEEVLQKLAAAVGADFTTATFTENAVIAGVSNDVITRAQLGSAYGVLRNKGVNFSPDRTFLAVNPIVGGNMRGATEFNAEATVGIRASEMVQQRAEIVDQFNCQFIEDANLAVATGVYPCAMFHTYAYGLRIATPPLAPNSQVSQAIVFPMKNVPVVLESWFEPKDQARYIHAYVICGHGKVRGDMCQMIATT